LRCRTEWCENDDCRQEQPAVRLPIDFSHGSRCPEGHIMNLLSEFSQASIEWSVR